MVEILKDFYLCFSLECDSFEIDDMPEGKLLILIVLQVKSETSLLVNRLKLAATKWLLTHDCISLNLGLCFMQFEDFMSICFQFPS